VLLAFSLQKPGLFLAPKLHFHCSLAIKSNAYLKQKALTTNYCHHILFFRFITFLTFYFPRHLGSFYIGILPMVLILLAVHRVKI